MIAVDALRFLPPAELAQCVRELYVRFRRIGDGDAVIATAATAVAALGEPERSGWAEQLFAHLRTGEENPVTLACLAELTEGSRRGALAEAAWGASLPPDSERSVGEALHRVSGWIEPARLASLQIEALVRWKSQAKGIQWRPLLTGLGRGLTPQALEWLFSHLSELRSWGLVAQLLPLLADEPRRRAAESWLQESRLFWTYTEAEDLRAACRYIPRAGDLLRARIEAEKKRGWFHLRGEAGDLGAAYAVEPLLAAGHTGLARELQSMLSPRTRCIADLAFVRHSDYLSCEAQLRTALSQLRLDDSNQVLSVYEAALEWFAPAGLLPVVVACARQLPEDLWLRFACLLQERGHKAALAAELSPAKLAALGVDRMRLDPELWLPHASPKLAIECWLHHFRSSRNLPRRQTLAGRGGDWCRDLLAMAQHAAGPHQQVAAAELVSTVLAVGSWFP